jgi:hypothetical protein
MKLTLLDIVQLILSDMDGDEVNSISDTVESEQIARIVKETYMDIISRADLPEHHSLFELEATTVATPTLMTLPTDALGVDWIIYNKFITDETIDPYFQDVPYKDMNTFLHDMYSLDTDEDNVASGTLTINGDSITLLWTDDKHPDFFTVFDDYYILFDSYYSDEDSTLQKTKSLAYGLLEPTWTHTDGATPDLDSKQFSLLIQEAKSQAFIDLKQVENPKAEQRARKAWLNMQRRNKNFKIDQYNTYPNYSRKG